MSIVTFTEVVASISNSSFRVITALQSYYSIAVVVTVAAAISIKVVVTAAAKVAAVARIAIIVAVVVEKSSLSPYRGWFYSQTRDSTRALGV